MSDFPPPSPGQNTAPESPTAMEIHQRGPGTLWKPRVNPWIVAACVALAAFMENLDTSIANVALPHIAGSLVASTNEATRVLTSYLLSNAIVLPMGAWA